MLSDLIGHVPSVVAALTTLGLVVSAVAALVSWLSEDPRMGLSHVEIGCYSCLLAPVCISWVLWMGMMIFPGKIPAWGYIAFVYAMSLLLVVVFRVQVAKVWRGFRNELQEFFVRNELGRGWCRTAWIVAGLFVAFIACWANYVTCYHFDMSEYILAGDYFARIRDISYHGRVVDPQNGFWLHAYHSYCLPLFATWGCFLRQMFGGAEDWYYRFILLYYWGGLNFVTFLIFCRRKMNKIQILAMGCAFLMLNSMPIVWRKVPFVFDCDNVRVSLIFACVWLLWNHLRQPKWGTCLLLGFLGSATVAAHGTSVFVVAIIFSSLLFARTSWAMRCRHMVVIAAIVLATWGLHYVLQTVCGDGWIFESAAGETLGVSSTSCTVSPADAGLVLNGTVNALKTPLTSLDDRFGNRLSLLFEGYLGQLFDIQHFSIAFVFILWGGVLLVRKWPQLHACHRALLLACSAVFLMIALVVYYNFRYRYTLIPLMTMGSFGLIAEFSRHGRSARKFWRVVAVLILVSPLALTALLVCVKLKEPSSVARFEQSGTRECVAQNEGFCRRTMSLITKRLHPRRVVPLWPICKAEDPHPRVVFSDASKIFYRAAPYPVWYCGKFSDIVGSRGPVRLTCSRLAAAFDYFVLSEQMRPDFIPAAFVPSDWKLVGRRDGCALYRSRIRMVGCRGTLP